MVVLAYPVVEITRTLLIDKLFLRTAQFRFCTFALLLSLRRWVQKNHRTVSSRTVPVNAA